MIRHLVKLIWNRKRASALVVVEIFSSFLVLVTVATLALYVGTNRLDVALDPPAAQAEGVLAAADLVGRDLRSSSPLSSPPSRTAAASGSPWCRRSSHSTVSASAWRGGWGRGRSCGFGWGSALMPVRPLTPRPPLPYSPPSPRERGRPLPSLVVDSSAHCRALFSTLLQAVETQDLPVQAREPAVETLRRSLETQDSRL